MKKNRFRICATLLVGLVFLMMGCGGGSDTPESSENPGTDGQVVVSLTDAPGDFVSYTVEVVSLTLTRADGTIVTTLPTQTRIDFSQYTDMTEFLTSVTVPSGVYVSATMTLDYTQAEIRVENQDQEIVQVAADAITDEAGDPVTQLEVTVQLEDRSHLTVAPGVPAHLMLDFNLEATNQVTFSLSGAPAVTVDPFLVAEVDCAPDKFHRIRGVVDGVSLEDGTFSVLLRPFFCAFSGYHSDFGHHTVTTSDDTIFQIDGEQYVGQDGLSHMADLISLEMNAPMTVVAVGDLEFDPLRFEAREVYVGYNPIGEGLDVVEGSVVGREADTLTIKGATLIRSDDTIVFNDLVTVTIGDETRVTRQFSTDPYTQSDISVGQRVRVLGLLTDANPLSLTLDATQGYARMLLTTLRGTVTGIDAQNAIAQVTADLQSINHRSVDVFDFSGTGIDADHDSDPEDYEINTSTLDLAALQVNSPVKLRGFVRPFGQAPADFSVHSIVDVADAAAVLKVQWRPATSDAFESVSSDGLLLNLDDLGAFHHLLRGWVITDLDDLTQAPMIIPPEGGNGVFVLHSGGVVQLLLGFDDFVEALQGYLEESAGVYKLTGVGQFDNDAATLSVRVLHVWLN